MDRVHRIARKAARRRLARAFVSRLGPAMLLAGAAAALLALADRLVGPGLPWWALVPPPLLLAAAWAVGTALRARRGLIEAAAEVDAALRLHDRLSSAVWFETRRNGDPFMALAVEDAERAAGDVDVRRATPLRFDWTWTAWPALAAAALAVAIFVPSLRLLADAEAQRTLVQEAAARESALQDIRTATTEAQRVLDARTEDLATPEELEALDNLARQLERGQGDADEARSRAAGALNNVAERLDERAAESQRDAQAAAERFAGADRPTPSPPQSAPLRDALRRGDFEDAAGALERLQREIDQLDQMERERVADDLESIAESLEQPPPDGAEGDETSRLREALHDYGVPPEAADEMLRESDAKRLKESLEDRGVAPEPAERLADRLAEENQRRQAEQNAEQAAREMNEALRDAADETRGVEDRPATEPRDQPQQPGADQPGQPAPPPQTPRNRESSGQGEQQREGAPPSGQPPQETREPHSPRDPATEGRSEGGGRPDQPNPDARQESSQPAGEPTRDSTQGGQPGSQPGERPGETPQNRTDSRGAPDPNRRPEPGAGPDAAQRSDGEPGEGGDGAASGFERAAERLRALEESRRNAEGMRNDADRLREESRRMLEDMSPEERERVRRWAEMLAQEQPRNEPATDTAPVDARRGGDSERVVAEWRSEAEVEHDPTISERDQGARIRDAVESAERAVEEQAVPGRHRDFIRRYFRRLPELVEPARDATPGAPGAPGAPAAPAQDVEKGDG